MNEQPTEKIYQEMIFNALKTFEQTALTFLRSINGQLANLVVAVKNLNDSVNALIVSQTETRNQRMQAEIDHAEAVIAQLKQEVEAKKQNQIESGKDTSDIIKVSQATAKKTFIEMLDEKELEQARHNKIDWVDVRNKAIMVGVTLILTYLFTHYILK